MDPDRKEWLIKSSYRDEYDFLLKNCYPALRHSDYYIGYNIRTYTDVEEIKRVFVENPQKLSLNEFYLLAQAYEPGSDELNYVFETAVKIYPDDEVANLNAAISESVISTKPGSQPKRYILVAFMPLCSINMKRHCYFFAKPKYWVSMKLKMQSIKLKN